MSRFDLRRVGGRRWFGWTLEVMPVGSRSYSRYRYVLISKYYGRCRVVLRTRRWTVKLERASELPTWPWPTVRSR